LFSSRVITQFDSDDGATNPVYRLISAISNDNFFISNYRKTHNTNENLFALYPILFSKYLTKGGKDTIINEEINDNYKDSTAFLLGVSKAKYQAEKTMIPED